MLICVFCRAGARPTRSRRWSCRYVPPSSKARPGSSSTHQRSVFSELVLICFLLSVGWLLRCGALWIKDYASRIERQCHFHLIISDPIRKTNKHWDINYKKALYNDLNHYSHIFDYFLNNMFLFQGLYAGLDIRKIETRFVLFFFDYH